MKNIDRFLALILTLCMIFTLCACSSEPAEPAVQPDETPVETPEAVDEGIAGTYHFEYVDEYGDTSRFSIKLRDNGTFTVMTSVGPLGDNVCSGSEWTDNGDGTFTTGESDNVLELDFIAEDGTIIWTMLDEEGNVCPLGYTEPTEFKEKPVEEEEAGPVGGVYTYLESGLAPFDTLWSLYFYDDGSYVLVEENERAGRVEYPGDSYTIDGCTVNCGPMGENRPGLFSWSDPEGFSVTTGLTTFVPIGVEGVELTEAPMTAVPVGYTITTGTYTYLESGLAPFDTLWTLILNADGSYVLVEENERAGRVEYPGASYTIDGSTVNCGPMGENRPGLFSWSDPEGFSITTGSSTFAPIGVEGVELAEEPAEAVPAGSVIKLPEVYTYLESGLAPFDTLWTLTLNEDGSYTLVEENERAGRVEYPGDSYTKDGTTVICGPMGDSRPGLFSWSDPEGFSVTIEGVNFIPVQSEE